MSSIKLAMLARKRNNTPQLSGTPEIKAEFWVNVGIVEYIEQDGNTLPILMADLGGFPLDTQKEPRRIYADDVGTRALNMTKAFRNQILKIAEELEPGETVFLNKHDGEVCTGLNVQVRRIKETEEADASDFEDTDFLSLL